MPALGGLMNRLRTAVRTRILNHSSTHRQDGPPPARTTSVSTLPPRYEPCRTLSSHGIPNVLWFQDALTAYDGSLYVEDLLLLVDDPPQAANKLSALGLYREADLGSDVDDETISCRGGIRLENTEPLKNPDASNKDGILLIDAAAWKYDVSKGTDQSSQPGSVPFLPPLPRFISSLLGYWLTIPEEEYTAKFLWASSVAELIYWAYSLKGPNHQLVRQPGFASLVDPEVLELHYDLICDYPGRMTIGAYRKHEYHALRYAQIRQGAFTPRPFSSLNFPVSLAEFPELTGMHEELERPVSSKRRSKHRKSVMSDLHLETPRFRPMYDDFTIVPQSPYLALLGDIGSVHDGRLISFLERQLQQFEIVFYVLGNHEPYRSDFFTFLDPADSSGNISYTQRLAVMNLELFEIENRSAIRLNARRSIEPGQIAPPKLGRFIFLNRRRFDLSDKVSILGATLFSHISPEQQSTASLFVSDFSNIDDWTVDAHNAMHTADRAWLNNEVQAIARENEAKEEGERRSVIILTHYSPTLSTEANDPEHLEDSRGVMSAFCTDLSGDTCWTSPCVKVWAFGHTHFNCDFVDDGGKRIVANQRGYGREDIYDFDPKKVITVD